MEEGKPLTEEEVAAKVTAAFDMIRNLCASRDAPNHRDWIMSIPARPDRDPDLVIGAALRAQGAEIRSLRRRLLAAEGALRECATYRAPDEKGCGDGGCIIEKPSGLHTNGGCQHLKQPGQYRTGRTLSALRQIARAALADGGGK